MQGERERKREGGERDRENEGKRKIERKME